MSIYLTAAAIVAMGASDTLDALSTVAESRGRALAAGALTAGDDTLALGVGIIGADTLLTQGWTQAIVLGILVFITTFITTSLATGWAAKHVPDEAH